MSEDSEPKAYMYSALEGQDGGSHHPFGEGSTAGRGSMGQLHLMSGFAEGRGRGRAGSELGLASEGSDSSSQDHGASPHGDRKRARSLHEDVDMKSSGSSGSGTESHSNESHGNESRGNESHGNESHGNESLGSSNSNSKDSALLESSGSNKSSNSHSPSPPSSSNAFSLLSASSEQDNPSTSGCSSEESTKAKTQKELIKTLKELKRHLPSEKRNKRSTSSTLNTLKYALHCVKQVKANEEYYQMLMTNDSHPLGLDVSSYTIEEIDSITSEYTLKNTDIFAVTVSLITGKIVYISDQAASILNCKRGVFKNSKFVEFLSPQDVSVFYSFTTPYRLPSWSVCTGAESSPSDCLQEKSFFCRISGGREHEGDLRYFPFRMTPYLMKVQDMERAEDQFCCLLLAERVHSGYEAPRIPTDKRIFTTTHSPNCVFQDVDERAVPLLGYLPQDLIGTPVLLHLHPSDRPIMLGVHRKILQFGGQPFDHSSIRFCTRNGEYVTLDTSWSSFVNPWSRKVSFIIGRHKVRMGPVNEDVFTPPPFAEGKTMDPDILEITEHIHRLLLQPIHSCSSGSYGEQLLNVERVSGESSSSRGRPEEVEAEQAKPRTFQEICKDIHSQKNPQQQIVTSISAKVETKRSPGAGTQQKSPAARPKAGTLSWKEDFVRLEDRPSRPDELSYKDQTINSYQQLSCLDSVIRYLDGCNIPVTVKRKCQSSSNTTSSNSDEDRQKPSSNPLPGSKEIIEDVTGSGEATEALAPVPPPNAVSSPSQEREPYKKLGLTKQVLAAHTQKEEQTFLCRFRELRGVRADCSPYLDRQRSVNGGPTPVVNEQGVAGTEAVPRAGGTGAPRKGGRNKKTKWKRAKKQESSDSTASHGQQPPRAPLASLQQTSWSTSDTSQSAFPMPAYPAVMPTYPAVLPTYPLQLFSGPRADPAVSSLGENQCGQDPRCPVPPSPYTAPMVTPVVALVLPNYVFPQIGGAPQQPFYPEAASFPLQPTFPPQPQFPPLAAFPAPPTFPPQPQFPPQAAFPAPPTFPQQPQFPPQAAFPAPPTFPPQPQFPPQGMFAAPLFQYGAPAESPKAPVAGSRSSTPQSTRDQASPPLFQSRCSSPLQLNLLQLEESQRSLECQEGAAPSGGTQGNNVGERGSSPPKADKELQPVSPVCEGHYSDGHSSSSDLLDILLQEDSRSGTGSATSGSLGSGSNGCGRGSSHTSNNSSKYFGSVDSSQTSQQGATVHNNEVKDPAGGARFKYVLQDPHWLLMANAGQAVMMTYQLPSRDTQKVLRQDREKLRRMQKRQPHFTEDQKKELMEVHPWMKKGGLPKAIDVQACMCCEEIGSALIEEEPPDLDLGDTSDGPTQKGSEGTPLASASPLAT
ncbi:period circadian protein homolog 2-like isoform X4 [Paramormyrops kingsleyae]|uniref:Period circadian protein homolog 2 n=1 Tax=Paramormyrops kingsleyae TaxID=1676925 RepID=A0A3B3RUE3_9TELE|nr:period circadian protein homolog 2-like isoform X4 [Paramormyrops kingsleyae]